MSHALPLVPHHAEEDLRQCYRPATDPVEKSHWQVIELKKQDKRTGEIATVTDYSAA